MKANNIYVISDIHGEFDLFIKMLKKINFSRNDRLIILGDVLDRGSQPIKIIEYVMEKDNIKLLMGNHEKMFLDFILAENENDKFFAYHMWMNNGGYTTLAEYDELDINRQEAIVNFIKNLSLYKIIDNYILVHSGLNTSGLHQYENIKKIMSKQTEEDLLWSREDFYKEKGIENYTVVFGHTPTPLIRNQSENYDFSIWYDDVYNDKIGIDC